MFTFREECAFIAAQYSHFHKVKTGESSILFAIRQHRLEMSLLSEYSAPALPETTRAYYAEIEKRKNQK